MHDLNSELLFVKILVLLLWRSLLLLIGDTQWYNQLISFIADFLISLARGATSGQDLRISCCGCFIDLPRDTAEVTRCIFLPRLLVNFNHMAPQPQFTHILGWGYASPHSLHGFAFPLCASTSFIQGTSKSKNMGFQATRKFVSITTFCYSTGRERSLNISLRL